MSVNRIVIGLLAVALSVTCAQAAFTVTVYEDGVGPIVNADMKAMFWDGQNWTGWIDAVEQNPGEYIWDDEVIPQGTDLIRMLLPSYLEPVSPDWNPIELDIDLLTFNWAAIDWR